MKTIGKEPRDILNDLFRRALAAVRSDRLAEQALQGKRFTHVIALGKAGEALAAGAARASTSPLFTFSVIPDAREHDPESSAKKYPGHRPGYIFRLGSRLRGNDNKSYGFLAYPRGYATGELPAEASFERHEGSHPVPDESSLEAGAALLRFADALPRDARVAVLVSGGASAGVEVPAAGVDLDFLQRANRWLLASGLPISDINRVRAGLSQLKGGGLARRLTRVRVQAWVLSDIPGGALAWVGGGLLSSPPAAKLPALPAWLERRLVFPSPADSPDVPLQRLAGNEEAVAAVVAEGAREMGTLAGEATELGQRIGNELAAIEPGLYVWGGEPTVRLPDNPGRGGRCQQLALAAAMNIAAREDCCLLAASTDGWDGTAPIAGACVDGGTVARGEAAGFDAQSALRNADAGRFLAASGDLIRTGQTGTHVNDLVIALKR